MTREFPFVDEPLLKAHTNPNTDPNRSLEKILKWPFLRTPARIEAFKGRRC
jgi:hypothetical protein